MTLHILLAEGKAVKIAESKYHLSRNLYLPKTVAKALELKLKDTVEFHTDGERIYLVKKGG